MEKKKNRLLALALVLLAAAVLLVSLAGRTVRSEYDEQQLDAAQRMQRCMDAVKRYKAERGIPLNPLDYHSTGMLGEEYNGITTTLGALEAKRTTANSDMAALTVRLLHEAGVEAGDTVGAGFSGSFPALNLAVLSACAVMDVNVVYIASVGASTYGANDPALTFPDMAHLLAQEGLIPNSCAAFSLGGGNDCGEGMQPELVNEILERLQGNGMLLLREPDFAANLAARKQLLGEIDCYVGVGGNITSTGRGEKQVGYGLIKRGEPLGRLNAKSGLLEHYHAEGLNVINLLDVKKLAADYGLAFDPAVPPLQGESAVYSKTTYPKVPAALALLAVLALLLYSNYISKRHE